MNIHSDLIVELDKKFSSKIGRVLFINYDKNIEMKLKIDDIIHYNNEKLLIKSFESIRRVDHVPMIAIQVNSI